MSESLPRIDAITAFLEAVRPGWKALVDEIDTRIADLTDQLIASENAETRGRIKQLRELKELPGALESERAQLVAPLSDSDGD